MVEELIRRARRRFILNESLGQTAFAASVTVGGLVLLLIAGTAWLQWWTIAVFAAVGIAIGAYKVFRAKPSAYKTAVHLDENARLKDTLSTSLYFAGPHGNVSESFLRGQHEQAEEAAHSVNLETAVPFRIPKALYAMAALCLLSSGLVGLRYRVGKGLDLRRPLTEVLFEDQAGRTVKKAGNFQNSKPGTWTEEAQELLAKLGIKPASDGPAPSDPESLDKAIEQAMQQPQNGGGKNDKGGKQENAAQGKENGPDDNSAGGDPIDSEKTSGNPKDGPGGDGGKEGEAGDKTASAKDSKDNSKESLMSKLKDAVSSLLSKSNPQPSTPQKSQEQKAGKSDKKSGEKKGDAGQGKPETGNTDSEVAEDDPNGDAMGGQKGQTKESSASNQKQSQEGSGIGTQDGSKELRAAEQIKAMGKISEIIGKRSATVSGETMVEVQCGNQALRTAYSKSNASHAETDGDVTRDEIPVGSQAYVQQYFQEMRKAATKKPDAKTTTP